MGKGDHVFNNIVAKLTKSFEAGLVRYFDGVDRTLRGKRSVDLARDPILRDTWMQKEMPRTWEALHHFKNHPDFVTLREKLQTSTYVGGDVNTTAYSDACNEFEEAVELFFRKLGRGWAPVDADTLLPDVKRVRRAFLRMTEAAEDPGALKRLLDEHSKRPKERERIEQEVGQVRESMRWAWGRCEYLFRMVTTEALNL